MLLTDAMTERKRPAKTANQLSVMLNQVLGPERFPVDVKALALEYSKSTCSDPIVEVVGGDFNDFNGMLKSSSDQTRWMIIYNANSTEGRQRFTIAHELGHYLLHRQNQSLFECGDATVDRDIEKEADLFAATLLMPMDDFRRQVDGEKPSFQLFSFLAERYGVSLTAAAVRWVEMAKQRAVLVASRDGFMLWATSNDAAYKSGAVFATRKNTIPMPDTALAVREDLPQYGETRTVAASEWFPRESNAVVLTEMMVATEQYDYTLTLLLLPDFDNVDACFDSEVELEDTYDHFIRNGQLPY